MREGHTFSPSQVNTVVDCPRRFGYGYVMRRRSPLPRGVEAYMGTQVHAIAERVEHHWAYRREAVDVNVMLRQFRVDWTANMPPAGLHVAKRGMKVDDYLRIGERCIQNLARVVPQEVHRPGQVVGIEMPLNWTVGSFPFYGIIDCLSVPEPGVFRVTDYKTSARPKSQDEADQDAQLGLYELGLRQSYPETEAVRLVWQFVATGTTVGSVRSQEQREALAARVEALCAKVTRTYERQVKLGLSIEDAWPAKPSGLCGWCDHRDVCPDSRAR